MANAINSLNFGNNTYTFTLPYGTCSTAAGTTAKTVDVDNFSLETGARVLVKFTVTNTASSPTLNVEGTGAKAIYYRGSAISAGYLAANRTYEFVYNGTQWELIGDVNTNTTYSAAGSSLGLVKSGGDVTISSGVITVNDDSHNHVISNIDGLQTALDGKSSTSHTHKYAGSSSAGGAATSANKVNESLIVQLNGGTTEGTNSFTFDGSAAKSINITSSAIGAATSSHTHDDRYYTESEVDTKLSGKANTSHGNHVPATQTASNSVFLRNDNTWATVTPANIGAATSSHSHSVATTSAAGFMSADDKSKLDGITSSADSVSFSQSLTSGTQVGTITINGTATKLYAPTNTDTTYSTMTAATSSAAGKAGLVPAPAAGKQTSFLRGDGTWVVPTNTTYSNFVKSGSGAKAGLVPAPSTTAGTTKYLREDGTWAVPPDTNTTYSTATTSANGLMSSSDKTKLNGIASNANNYSLPTASSSTLGGVKTTSTVTSTSGLTACPIISGVPYYKDTNTTYSLSSFGVTASATELNYTDGVTSNIQTQLDGKADTSHEHGTYMTKSNPVGTGSISLNRKANTDVGGYSIAMGCDSTASENHSIAMGYSATASGTYSAAMGMLTKATGGSSIAIGRGGNANGNCSMAMGCGGNANGNYSTAMGYSTTASGDYSMAMGYATQSLSSQHVIGHYNSEGTAASTSGTTGDAFIIGKGSSTSKSNAMRVTYAGKIFAATTTISAGADYAEYFEWQDLNPNNEDRRGYFVTLDGERIKIAEPNDYILGIVSGMPCVIGNGDEDWKGRYIQDEFGAFITEEFEYEEETFEKVVDEETGETTLKPKTITKTGTRYKENPDYDATRPYIQREDRPEWDAVGMVGVLSVRDDGTCKVNGFCKVGKGGIATASEDGYRVISRVNENIVRVVFK